MLQITKNRSKNNIHMLLGLCVTKKRKCRLMSIQSVSFLGVEQLNKRPKHRPKTGSPTLTTRPDTFEKTTTPPAYDRDGFKSELEGYRDKKGKPVYANQHIIQILKNVDKEPERLTSLKEMAALPNMKGKDLARISYAKADTLEIVNEFSKKKKENGNPKYASSHLIKFSTLQAEDLTRIKPLTNTTLHPDEIINIAQDKQLNLEKLSVKINEMEKACGSKSLDKVSFKKDIYDPENAYVITGTTVTGITKSELLDKKLNRLAIDKTVSYTANSGKDYILTKTNDYRNNTISQVRQYLDQEGYPIVESQVRIVKDKNGKKLNTEYMTLSDVKGVYNAKTVYPDGREEITSSGKIDKKTGIVSVKRNMQSLDGTKTDYLYENDPQGNRIIDYKITDKNGKVLLNYSQSLEVINDKKYISSKNNNVYEVTVSDDEQTMTIKDRNTKEENQINLGKTLRGNKKSMVNLLKKFPGEELIQFKDTTKILKGMEKLDDCCYWPDKKEIDIIDDLYSMLHELGHAKDNKDGYDGITNRKDVQEVYNKEKEAFNKAFPNAQRDHINYFIDVEEHYSGRNGGLSETVAESNALLNSYNGQLDIAARAHYLQQYFPKTIAKLATVLHKV